MFESENCLFQLVFFRHQVCCSCGGCGPVVGNKIDNGEVNFMADGGTWANCLSTTRSSSRSRQQAHLLPALSAFGPQAAPRSSGSCS